MGVVEAAGKSSRCCEQDCSVYLILINKMPPKNAQKGGGAASKKTEQKKKEKIIEDKTFGLKNKKGAKNQKYIQQVEKQVKSGGQRPNIDREREEAQKKMEELNDLFRPVQNLGSKGSDPKSILCAFYKQ